MDTPKRPSADGSVLALPGFVDFHAVHNPDRPLALLVPETGSEVKSISFLEFANATHRIAHLQRPDGDGTGGDVVIILVHCDTILYLALVLGLIRAGLVPFLVSPRNSVPAITNLIEKTSCHRIITQPSFHPLLDAAREVLSPDTGYALRVDNIPDVYAIFPTLKGGKDFPVSPFPPPSKQPTVDDVALILHSSGSTGLPKPVPQKHINVLEWSRSAVITKAAEVGVVWAPMALPTFHIMGIWLQLYGPLMSGYPVALHHPRAPLSPLAPTPQNVIEGCKLVGASGVPMVPTFIEVCAQSDDDLAYLASMKIVMFAGGPLSQKTGDKLATAGVKFFAAYGSTEGGANTDVFDIDYSAGPNSTVKSKEDWAWLSLTDSMKPRWIPQGDGSYELQLLTCDTHKPAVENIPDVRGYATNDLFIPHPTKKGLWRIIGRKDDVIILASGENVVPIPHEGHVTSSPLAIGAIMFGHGKDQCGILIEPSPEYLVDVDDPTAVAIFRDRIWPVVDESNRNAPAFARVFKQMILVTDPARPLPRAGKGTVMRKQAMSIYAADIEKLYETTHQVDCAEILQSPKTWTVNDVQAWLVQLCTSFCDGKEVSPTVNLFDQGLDSLLVTLLRNQIVGALESETEEQFSEAAQRIPQNVVYAHPTLSELATTIVAIINPGSATTVKDHCRHIMEMIEKYSADIPTPVYAARTVQGPITVLLTGSTGHVGSHVLASLLADSRIEKVYTLNRPSTQSEDRQRASFVERGLPESLLDGGKLVPLVGDLTTPELGLGHSNFSEVIKSVTHIIHNAWNVNFNHTLASFEPQISATRKLLDVCATSSRPIRLLFVSSVSAARNWPISNGEVPEESLADPIQTSTNGYGASKFVVENILGKAAQQGIPCTSLRVGQVCGARISGVWPTSEWVPIMLKSSIALGALPTLEGGVSWIPVDALANAMVDLVVTSEPLPTLLNVVHPHRASGSNLIVAFNACLDTALPTVTPAEWLSKLERAAEEGDANSDTIPAISLLEFFRELAAATEHAQGIKSAAVEAGGQPVFATEKLQRLCPAIADLELLGEQHVKAWVAYWRGRGFLGA